MRNNSKTTNRIINLLLLLTINGILIYAIAQLMLYYSTGTHEYTLNTDDVSDINHYNPYTTWKIDSTGNFPQTLDLDNSPLPRDYINSWYFYNLSLSNNEMKNLDQYFTDSLRRIITTNFAQNKKQNLILSQVTLNHSPTLNLLSVDNKVSVVTDSNVLEIKQLINSSQTILKSMDTSTYRMVLLLEDGRWHVHKKKRLAGVSHPFPSNTNWSSWNLPSVSFSQSNLSQLKGINYYPQKTPWSLFWKMYDSSIVTNDLILLSQNSFNSLRFFIPFIDVREKYTLNTTLNHVNHFLSICDSLKLTAIPCLFDFYNGPDPMNWPEHYNYLQTIIPKLSTHQSILFYDIKNEPDLDFKYYPKQRVLDWLCMMAMTIKKIDTIHGITIGWSHFEKAIELGNVVDVITFHDYESPHLLESRYQYIHKQYPDKGIAVTECGKSTFHSYWYPIGNNETDQANYYAQWNSWSGLRKVPYYAWTMYDFDSIPNAVVGKIPWRKKVQEEYGLLSKNGQSKMAWRIIINNEKYDFKVPSPSFIEKGPIIIVLLIILLSLILLYLLFFTKKTKL